MKSYMDIYIGQRKTDHFLSIMVQKLRWEVKCITHILDNCSSGRF
jgi:hypothetical protein